MRSKIKRITAMILAVVMVLIAVPVMPGSSTVYADEVPSFPYDGGTITAIAENGDSFGMFSPQDGTTCVLDGDTVLVHYIPKNTTVYGGFIWGGIGSVEGKTVDDCDVKLIDGAFDFTLTKAECGKAGDRNL